MQTRQALQWHRVSIVVTSVTLGVFVASSPARAQSAEAEMLFSDGNRLMNEGKLAQACEAFEASNRAEPGAGALIRLGECREQNQQLASAWFAYEDALIRVKDPHKREIATAKATALASRLSYLTVFVSDQSRIEGLTLTRNGVRLDPMSWNRPLPVNGGDYIIAGVAPDHKEWQTTVHLAVEGANVSIEVPRLQELAKLTLPALLLATPSILPLVAGPRQDRLMPRGVFTTRSKIFIGLAGISAISMVTGMVLGTSANKHQNDAFTLCHDPATPCAQADRSNALIRSSRSRAFEANVSFGIGAAAAACAGVLWLIGAPGSGSVTKTSSVVPSFAHGSPSIVILRRF